MLTVEEEVRKKNGRGTYRVCACVYDKHFIIIIIYTRARWACLESHGFGAGVVDRAGRGGMLKMRGERKKIGHGRPRERARSRLYIYICTRRIIRCCATAYVYAAAVAVACDEMTSSPRGATPNVRQVHWPVREFARRPPMRLLECVCRSITCVCVCPNV